MSERGIPLRARVAAALAHASPEWSALLASRAMGVAARTKLPPKLGRLVVGAYSRVFGVNLNEVDPVSLEEGFDSFDAFFTRRLREGSRFVDRSPNTIVSPSDGELREILTIERDTEVVAKGQSFGIAELLADAEAAEYFVGGTSMTIYLHPRDYHRVHVPCDALAHRVTLVPGRLLPVTGASIARDPRVLAVNERMIHLLETGHGWLAVVMVAAFGVGNMSCAYDRFEAHPRELEVHQRRPPARLRKADELGVFHLGSTVIVLAQPSVRPVPGLTPGTVHMGQALLEEHAG